MENTALSEVAAFAEPVFTSVGQALFVAYLMEILPPTQKVSTQILIESLREQSEKLEARMASSINMGNLTPLEFRGQCALIRGAADHHLTHIEHDAVRARFGHQRTKSIGVRGLADYMQPMCNLSSDGAMLAVTWWCFHKPTRLADRYSLQDVARQYCAPLSEVKGAVNVIRKTGANLEVRALGRLGELFIRTGLVEST